MAKTFENCKTLNDFEEFYPLRQGLQQGAEVTRVAPSPTGMPHIGTGMQAILDRALADQTKGIFILRLDDTDRARFVPGATEEIMEAIKWLDMIPDEGFGFGGDYGPYVQSERLPIYHAASNHLLEIGEAYHCFCSSERLDELREFQIKHKKMPMYDRKCRHLTKEQVQANLDEGKPFVIRMKIPEQEEITVTDEVRGDITFKTAMIDDTVLIKSDGFPTYHLATIVDDRFMRITTVVRGEEWIPSMPKHLILYKAFGWKPPRFLHTVLLRDFQKRKLSKRSGDTSLGWFRRQGFLAQGFVNFLMRIMWTHPDGKDVYPYDDFIKHMKTKGLPSTGPVADIKLLQFINNAYISAMSDTERAQAFKDYLAYLVQNKKTASSTVDPQGEPVESNPETAQKMLAEIEKDFDYTVKIMAIKPGRYDRLGEMIFSNGYFYDSTYVPPTAEQLQAHMPLDQVPAVIETFSDAYGKKPDDVENIMKTIATDLGLENKQVFMTLRLAITGFEKTPPLNEILPVLGMKRAQDRLQSVADFAGREANKKKAG